MLWKIARERSVRFSAKNATPTISAPQWTAARSEKNLPTASKKASMPAPSDAEASTPITSDQAYALRPPGAADSSELVVEILVELVVELGVLLLIVLVLVDVVETEIVLAVKIVLILVLVSRAEPLAGLARCGN